MFIICCVKKSALDEYEFIEMNQILTIPFLDVKDRVVTETDYILKDNLAFLPVYRMNMVMTEFLTGWSILKQNFH